MNRQHEIEKYLLPLLQEEPEETTATALQESFRSGYLEGYKKAHDECDRLARELSQIKSGCSKWLDEHDAKVRADTIEEILKLPRNTYKTYEHGFIENEEAIFVSDILDLKEKKNE